MVLARWREPLPRGLHALLPCDDVCLQFELGEGRKTELSFSEKKLFPIRR